VILEHAVLDVREGEEKSFESAFGRVRPLIEKTPGFQRLELRPCIERAGRYLLLVWWDSVEAHTQGFRGSARYAEWKKALHHFYEPFPEVQHYAPPL
jgi:heme-degrading monooxygenase HmoA